MQNQKIIIAGASQGFGHMKAAFNISNALTATGLETPPRIIDIFDYFPFAIKFISLKGWKFVSTTTITTKFHSIYDYVYRHSLQSTWKQPLTTLISKIVAKQLIDEYRDFPPDIFIATHAMAVPVGAILKDKLNCRFYMTATDYIVHSSHIASNMDMIFIPPECEIRLSNYQVKFIKNRINAAGIPIDTRFAQKKNRNDIKEKLLLKSDLKTILVSFGGDGLKALTHLTTIQKLLETRLPLQFIVLTGKNEQFTTKMNRLYGKDERVKIISYKDDISDYYAAADLFLGKAGGLSISEAVTMNLPMLFIDKLPGQEEFNIKIMAKMKLGEYTPTFDMLISKIESYLAKSDYQTSNNFIELARPKSSQTIANSILNII